MDTESKTEAVVVERDPSIHPSIVAACDMLFSRVHGLQAVLVSTSLGSTLMKVSNPAGVSLDVSKFEGVFSTVFAMADEQADKLPFGKVKSCTAFLESAVLHQVSEFPLVISFVATPDGNVGLLMQLVPKLQAVLEPMRKAADLVLGA